MGTDLLTPPAETVPVPLYVPAVMPLMVAVMVKVFEAPGASVPLG
jgi:hypothetical protein